MGERVSEKILFLALFNLAVVVPTVLHALLYKRHSRAALGWIAFIIAWPYVGAVFYVLFGINRVRTRSRKLSSDAGASMQAVEGFAPDRDFETVDSMETAKDAFTESEFSMLRAGSALTKAPLSPANRVRPLYNGEGAYPVMLEAIRKARSHVWLTTYIFETNAKGMEFIDALIEAHRRGVDVRVVLDGIGELYFWPLAGPKLRKAGVPLARFLPPKIFPPQVFLNLRNHRKLLVVDGDIAFTGGMNIGGRHMAFDPANPHPVQDLHFSLEGPVVRDFELLFLRDWAFSHRHDGDRPPHLPSGAVRDALRRTRNLTRRRSLLANLRVNHALDLALGASQEDIDAVTAVQAEHARASRAVASEPLDQGPMPNPAAAPTDAPVPDHVAIEQSVVRDPAPHLEVQHLGGTLQVVDVDEPGPREVWPLLGGAHDDDSDQDGFDAWCRVILDGPDHDLSKLETLIGSVISSSTKRVLLFSPYFLPTDTLESALVNAALRGVDVTVVIPENTNQPLVHAAMYRTINWMLRRGVKVLLQPDPFAHTKLLIIDDRYVQMGSANMDPRSLRLNFELGVEVVDEGLVNTLMDHYRPILAASKRLTPEMVRARPWPKKVFGGFAWLFSPYL